MAHRPIQFQAVAFYILRPIGVLGVLEYWSDGICEPSMLTTQYSVFLKKKEYHYGKQH
jgi:hypothetical protein